MSFCISSNFSSFFLDSLNDPSEFAKYLSNGDNRMVPIVSSTSYDDYSNSHHHHPHFHHQNGNGLSLSDNSEGTVSSASYNLPPTSYNHQSSASVTPTATASEKHPPPAAGAGATTNSSQNSQHFDGSFEFLKYLRYSADYGGGEDSVHSIQSNTTNSSLIDLDSTPTSSHKGAKNGSRINSNSNNFDLDSTYDHDSKHNIFDLHNQNNSCSSTNNSDSMMTDPTILAPHLSASNSNPSSECGSENSNNLINNNNISSAAAAAASAAAALNPKALMKFVIKENFDVHPSHKVEEGIFQHMNKLPLKKKDQLKALGVTFTGHMSISDKSIIVENFTKFCQVSSSFFVDIYWSSLKNFF